MASGHLPPGLLLANRLGLLTLLVSHPSESNEEDENFIPLSGPLCWLYSSCM